MASITDKFGRPSAVTGYANPTTVRASRLAGETTLSAYDLSGFDDTTPLYFVTYKKTTEVNPDTGLQEEKIVNQVSFKGIVNLDNNTITDLEVSPGYSDLGNDVGDYIESVPTSHWGNDLVGGLLVSHNPDGTLKADSVTTAALADNSVTTAKIANKAVKATKIDLATLQFVDANGWRVTEGVKRTYTKIVSHPSASNIGSLVPANSITTSLPSGKSNTQVEIESVTPSSNTISYLYASAVTEPGLVRIQVRNVSGSAQNIPTTKIVIKLVDA